MVISIQPQKFISQQLWTVRPTLCMTPASVAVRRPAHLQQMGEHVTLLPARRPVDVQMVLSLTEEIV